MKLLSNFRKAALTLTIAASGLALATAHSYAEVHYSSPINLSISLSDPSQCLYFNVVEGTAWLGVVPYMHGAPLNGAHFGIFYQRDFDTDEPMLDSLMMTMTSAYLPGVEGGMLSNWGSTAALNGITRLSSGDVVSGTLSDEDQGYSTQFYFRASAGEKTWTFGDRGFIGLQFQPADTVLYGWAELSYNSDMTVTLYRVAYEDNGGSIEAIPEPSSVFLCLTAAGTMALGVLRRRKVA